MFLSSLLPAFLILHTILYTQASNSTLPELSKENKTEIIKPEIKINSTENATQSIVKPNLDNVLEGGRVSANIVNVNNVSSTTETTRPYGREHVTEASISTANKVSFSSTTETILNVEKINNSTNGAKSSTSGLANNIQVTSSSTRIVTGTDEVKMSSESMSSTTETIIPISEKIDTKMDHKKTVPKKGVNFTETLENMTFNKSTASNLNTTTTTTSTTTTTTAKPKKPLITVGNDEEPFASSNFIPGKINGTNQKVPSIESYENNNRSRSGPDYIVPIVGVILSVPLVAILLNAVYKRTKEWWHHRHYSRMDFLIDGMYNN